MLNNKAYQKPATSKPLTRASQIRTIKALITNKNKPNVSIVTGRVNKISKGFTNRLSKIKTAATTTAVKKPET